MNAGVRTNNISNKVPVSDDLLVNRQGSTGLQAIEDLAIQLLAGAIGDAISASGGNGDAIATEVLDARAGSESLGERLGDIVEVVAGTQVALQQAAGSEGTLPNRLANIQKITDVAGKFRPTSMEFRPGAPFMPRQKSFSVQLPAIVAASYGGDLNIPAQTVTFDAPASATVTETKTLHYPGVYNGAIDNSNFAGQERLQYQYVSNVAVVRTSDNLPLTKGLHYDVKPNTGLIYGLQNVADYQVTITYTGHKHRYDSLYGPTGGASQGYGMVKGTDRIVDPEEYLPVVPAGFDEVWRLYISVNPDGSPRADLIPRYRYKGRALIARPGEYADFLDYNQGCLAQVIARCERGLPLTIVVYGDSNWAMGGGMGANQTVANADRDVLSGQAGFFQTTSKPEVFGRMPADTAASIPRFDGPLGAGQHIRIGAVWYLAAALQNKYRIKVTVLNRSVPGSTTANTMVNGIMNGLYTTRFNAFLGDVKDALVIFGKGMNEIGSAATYSNLRGMIGYTFAAGAAGVIVAPPAQVNYPGGADAFAQAAIGGGGWLSTHSQCIRAARDSGAAFIDMVRLDGQLPSIIDLGTPPQLPKYPIDPELVPNLNTDLYHYGCSGLAWRNLCNTNLYNHLGREQNKQVGYCLADLFGIDEWLADPNHVIAPLDTVGTSYRIVLPSGMIEIGGPITADGQADKAIAFPTAFPTACVEVETIEEPTDYSAGVMFKMFPALRTASGFTIVRRQYSGGAVSAAVFGGRYRARGY
jgi:hypothetical protein